MASEGLALVLTAAVVNQTKSVAGQATAGPVSQDCTTIATSSEEPASYVSGADYRIQTSTQVLPPLDSVSLQQAIG